MSEAGRSRVVDRAITIAKIIAAVALVWLVVVRVDLHAVAARLLRLDVRYVAAFLALSVPFYLLCAARWRFTAQRLGAPLSFRRALVEYYVSTLLNQVLPIGIAGDVMRAARHRGRLQHSPLSASWGPPARAIVLERFSGIIALVVFAFASAIIWYVRGVRVFGLGAAVACAVVALGMLILGVRARGSPRMAAISNEARAALVDHGALGFQLAVSIAAVAVLVLMFAFAARATGVALDAASAVSIVPLILAATTFPWAFSGWGAREATAAALFALAGVGAEAGVAASVAFGVLSLVAASPGVVVLCLPHKSANREAA